MSPTYPAVFRALTRSVPFLVLLTAVLGTACGSSSTNVVAPTTQKCQISVTNFTGAFGPSGGSGTASVDAARECSWSAASGASWITLASPASGTGSGTLSFTVQPNTVPRARSGSLDVNAQQLTVSQGPAPCQFSVNPTSVAVAAAGGSASVGVSANDGSCAWSATSEAPWIGITGAGGANGSGSVSFTVATNTGDARSGNLVVAGQSITVSQAAPITTPTPTPTPAPPSPGPGPTPVPTPTPTPTPTPGPTTSVQLTGSVSGRKGDCPTLTFFVQGIEVTTNQDTVFVNSACNKVKNGLQVQVDGVQQAGQPVVATRVTSLN